jgi:tetratricopeptide (TPR) repeat protein
VRRLSAGISKETIMRRRFFFCFIFIFIAFFVFAEDQKLLLLQNVVVIDGTGASAKKGMTVIIRGNHIDTIEKSSGMKIPEGASVVDCRGKFLIPGLWDMHVHWYDKRYLQLFITNGVTGTRMMWGSPDHFEWRKQEANGSLIGPRMVIGSTIIDGPTPVWPGSIAVSSEAEGRKAVDDSQKNGAEFIKVYSLLPRDAYFAIADESRIREIPFAGHVPNSVSAMEASDAGQKSIEHLTGILLEASTREEEFRKALMVVNDQGTKQVFKVTRDQADQLLATYSDKKATELFRHFAKNGTWQVPTLTVLRAIANLDDPKFIDDPRLKYVPQSVRMIWDPKNDFRFAERKPEDWERARRVFQKDLEIVKAMNRANVPILAGTDTLNPYCFPGFSLHDELALLVQAGLTPMQAILTATKNPAQFFGQLDSYGTIEPHKIADLVLLSANPLEDIHNTTKIDSVIFDGHLYAKPEIEKMTAEIEKFSSQKSIAGSLSITIMQKGVNAAVERYRKLKTTEPDTYDFSEGELDTLGYQLIEKKKFTEAIEILKLNVESFPESWTVYDSLAEAYLASGDKEHAAENFRKSLEKNSKNQNAIDKLKQMQ